MSRALGPGFTGRVLIACLLLSACDAPKTGEISPETRMRVAQAAETSGDMELARRMYATAAAETLGDRAMQMRAVEGLLRGGAPADAMALLEATLRRAPRDHEARRALASLQITNGMPGQAEQNLAMVLAARPDDDFARINRGVALDMLRRHTEAQALYRAVLARIPGEADAANDLALSLMLSGQRREAQGVLAPFRGRGDLAERMRTTMTLVDGAAGDPGMAALSQALGVQAGPVPVNAVPAR